MPCSCIRKSADGYKLSDRALNGPTLVPTTNHQFFDFDHVLPLCLTRLEWILIFGRCPTPPPDGILQGYPRFVSLLPGPCSPLTVPLPFSLTVILSLPAARFALFLRSGSLKSVLILLSLDVFSREDPPFRTVVSRVTCGEGYRPTCPRYILWDPKCRL